MKPEDNITVRRQNRRNIMMRAVPGGIEVFIPHWMEPDSQDVQKFIRQGVKKLKDHIPKVPVEQTDQAMILALVQHWSAKMNLTPSRVQLREMTRKWGSCSSKGTITLNTRLTWLEHDLVEYVVVHELAHLIELNHSKRFWAVVEKYLPDYKARKNRLDETTRNLW